MPSFETTLKHAGPRCDKTSTTTISFQPETETTEGVVDVKEELRQETSGVC